MKRFLMLSLVALVLAGTGCQTSRPVDVAKAEEVKAVLEPLLMGTVRRALRNSPEHREEILTYLRAIRDGLREMIDRKEITPEQVMQMADRITSRHWQQLPDWAIDTKNAVLSLYRIQYAGRFRAELPPDQWPFHVLDLIHSTLDRVIRETENENPSGS